MENKDEKQNSVMFEAPDAESFENEEKKFHVMPDKFLPKEKSKNGKKIAIFIIIILGIIVLGGGGFLLYQNLKTDNTLVVATNLNSNLNSNENTNINTNTNTNANTNVNLNSNLNGNVNSNTNINTNTNSNTNTNTNSNANSNKNINTNLNFDFGIKTNIPDSLDDDSDGLTNEEEMLFGSDKNLPDTDGDTFLDGDEVKNGYNPVGEAELAETAIVDVFENNLFNYQVYYPADWVYQALSNKYTEIIITSPSGELVEILVLENSRLLSAKSWYLNQVPKSSSSDLVAVTIAGFSGIKTIDGYSYFVAKGDKIYSLVHDIGIQKEVDYRTVFEMIVNSFEFVEATSDED